MSKNVILAGDIGGSHISIGRFVENSDSFLLDNIQRTQIDSYASKSKILEEWAVIIRNMVHQNEIFSLSLAMPAPFDYEQGICLIQEQGKFKHLYNINIRNELSGLLGIYPSDIKFINDAKAFLLGETFFGQMNGAETVLGLTLGSGLGSSIKKDRQVVDGELWQSPFRDGIAEDYLGSTWFVNWVKRETGIQVNGVKEIIQNREILDKAGNVFDVFADNLAEFISLHYPKIQMEKVVLGGNISLSSPYFLNKLMDNLAKKEINIPVEVSQLGEKSAIYGALTVFFENNN
ncbi:ROK family protein [Aquiflexum sp.]|uniref:ROK family protein n=1 Tax=Aquiflexum sp. TaxID=1872584 RepID=UPI0035945863